MGDSPYSFRIWDDLYLVITETATGEKFVPLQHFFEARVGRPLAQETMDRVWQECKDCATPSMLQWMHATPVLRDLFVQTNKHGVVVVCRLKDLIRALPSRKSLWRILDGVVEEEKDATPVEIDPEVEAEEEQKKQSKRRRNPTKRKLESIDAGLETPEFAIERAVSNGFKQVLEDLYVAKHAQQWKEEFKQEHRDEWLKELRPELLQELREEFLAKLS